MRNLRRFETVAELNAAIANSTIGLVGLAFDDSGKPVVKTKEVQPTPPAPDPTIPFYIEDISGSENTVQIKKNNNSAPTLTIQKSTDGTTWESMGTTSTTAITATIPANGKLYLRCSTNTCGTSYNYYNTINTTGNCNVSGNIMSLLYGSNFTGEETTFPSGSSYNFCCLFRDNTHLVDASDLILPATTLAQNCYGSMFKGCTSLTTAPALSATTLAEWCYYSMFQGCTALTTAPELPATKLADGCYGYMFANCTSLTTAPALPATTLISNCYSHMFSGCTKLNYIKCLATDISASSCTDNWTYRVASTGTFVKNADMSASTWRIGANGIPEGWTVQDA